MLDQIEGDIKAGRIMRMPCPPDRQEWYLDTTGKSNYETVCVKKDVFRKIAVRCDAQYKDFKGYDFVKALSAACYTEGLQKVWK